MPLTHVSFVRNVLYCVASDLQNPFSYSKDKIPVYLNRSDNNQKDIIQYSTFRPTAPVVDHTIGLEIAPLSDFTR